MKNTSVLKLIFYPIALAILFLAAYFFQTGLTDLFTAAANQWNAPIEFIFTALVKVFILTYPLLRLAIKIYYATKDEVRLIKAHNEFLSRMRAITCLPIKEVDSVTSRSGHFVERGSSWRDFKTKEIMIVDRIVCNDKSAFVAFKGSIRIWPIDYLNGKRFIEVTQADYAKTFKDFRGKPILYKPTEYIYEPSKPF